MAFKLNKPVIDVSKLVSEYDSLRTQESIIKKRKDELSALLKDYAEKNGTKDDKGSFYAQTDDFVFGKQAKKSVTLNDQALPFFKEKYPSCVVTTEYVDTGLVDALIDNGTINTDELTPYTEVKTTYAIDVRKKAAQAEVQQTTVAASTKHSFFIKG